jgi:hypothetical protein
LQCLAPPPGVRAASEPRLPEQLRLVQELLRLRDPDLPRRPGTAGLQHDATGLTGMKRYRHVQIACIARLGLHQPLVIGLADRVHGQHTGRAAEHRAVWAHVCRVGRPAVVETGRDLDVERHLATHAPEQSHNATPVGGHLAADRHEVIDLTDPGLTEEPGDQDGGVRQIHLLGIKGSRRRPDSKATALLVVEQRPEDAGRVESRSTEPVDRAVCRHERGSLQITDQAVVCNGRVVIHGDPRG